MRACYKHRASQVVCVGLCSVVCVSSIISANVCVFVCVCEAVDSRQASLLSFCSLPKGEAKRGKAAAFNPGAEGRRRQRTQIKQMAESGLESRPRGHAL